jgi:hypothetical protein
VTADQIDSLYRVLTRRRLERLQAVGLFPNPISRKTFQHYGPLAPLDRLLDENEPAQPDMVENDYWRDGDKLGDWGVVTVWVEPDWHVEPANPLSHPGQWKVWADWGDPADAGEFGWNETIWATEQLARRYLELLTDNFWVRVTR